MKILMATAFLSEIFKVILGLLATIATASFAYLLRRINNLGDEVEKNTESMNMVLNRIFGIDRDPTDEGHIMETEKRFDDISKSLEEIKEVQEQSIKERRKEHEEVNSKISSIISVMEENEEIDIETEDFET